MFDREERGSKMSIYISAPLLGPALGPIFGGVLTSLLGWRSIFWFLTIISGVTVVVIVFFFRDTFRKERSLVYRDVVAKRLIKLQSHLAEEKQIEKANIQHSEDVEKQICPSESPFADVKISLKDVNPIKPILGVVKQRHNLVILFASALIAAFGFIIGYTSSRTLALKYNFDPLKIGLVNLSYGSGCVVSSFITGWWSDRQYARMKALHGEVYAELRLKNSVYGGLFLPPFILALGWLSHAHVHVAALAVMLFACGCCTTWMYNSLLTYIIDSNVGRSSSATATNSAIRGVFLNYLQSLGDGVTYSVWAGLMVVCELLTLLVYLKGRSWREAAVTLNVKGVKQTT
ncbi:major facilitator superfamily domain-containing protein [Cyathus striatus]|nr:major facilitator superfamily domain-containing protein [Cyathus striatus]